MTATILASNAAPSQAVAKGRVSNATLPSDKAIPVACLSPMLAAHDAASMATYYLRVGNVKAARRKLVQALESVNQASEGGAA